MDSANADTKKCIWVKKKRRGKGSNQLYHSGQQRAFQEHFRPHMQSQPNPPKMCVSTYAKQNKANQSTLPLILPNSGSSALMVFAE